MDDQETTVKNEICSLLVSTPLSCTIKQLCYDYRSQIGHEIPYLKLGYNSVEHFLRSIPDKVLVSGTGPQAQLKLVLSEKSAHVNAMVLKQKVNTKQKSCMNRRRALPHSYYNNFQGQRSPSQRIVYPNHVRSSNISQPTQNYGMPSCSQKNYEQFSNTSVPTHTNYKNPSSYSQVTTPVSDFNNHQPVKSPQNNYNYPPKSLPPQRNTNAPQVTDRLQEEILRHDSYGYDNVAASHTNDGFKPNQRNDIPFKCDSNQANQDDTTKTSPSGVQCAQEVVTPTQRKLELKDFKKKLTIGDAFEQNVSLVPNTVPPKNRITINLNLDKKSTCESEASQIDIPKSVQDNLRKLISSHPEGIWCAQLPELYMKNFRRNLNYNEYGYRSLISLCMDLPELFHYVRPSNGDFKLYDRSKPLPEEAERTFTVASYSVTSALEAPLPNLGCPSFVDYLPRDIVVDEVIPRQFIPEGAKQGVFLNIAVAEIFDLSKFWIYLRGNGLDELMDELQLFYGKDDQYLIPDLLIKQGLYCVCKFFSEYHRAVILKVFENGHEIKVLFVDYGTVTKVSRDGIYFLKKQFAKLPFQSIRARLANIYPVHANTTWSIRDTELFHILISRKTLEAQINKILPEQVLDLYLYDCGNRQCINDLLVKEGVALYTTQERKILADELGYKPLVKHLHLFPSHIDFELGIMPSTADYKVLSSLEVPFQLIYHQYFECVPDNHLVSTREKWCDDFKEYARDIYRISDLFPKHLTAEDVREVKSFTALDTSIYGPFQNIMKDRIKKQHIVKQNKHKTRARVKRNEHDEELFKSVSETVNVSSDCPEKEMNVQNECSKDDKNHYKDDKNFDSLLHNMNSEEKTSKWILDLNSNTNQENSEYEDEYLESSLVTRPADFSEPDHNEPTLEKTYANSPQFVVDGCNLNYQFTHNIPKHLGRNLSNKLYDQKVQNTTDGLHNVVKRSSHVKSNNYYSCSNSENESYFKKNFAMTFEETKQECTEDLCRNLYRTSEKDRTSDQGTTLSGGVSVKDQLSSKGSECTLVYQENIDKKNAENKPSKEGDVFNNENMETTSSVERNCKEPTAKVQSDSNISIQSSAQNIPQLPLANSTPFPSSNNNCGEQVVSPALNSSQPVVTECKVPSSRVQHHPNISHRRLPQNYPQLPNANLNVLPLNNFPPNDCDDPVMSQAASLNPGASVFQPQQQVNQPMRPPPGFFPQPALAPVQPIFVFNSPMFFIHENKPDFFSSYNYLLTLNAAASANGVNIPNNPNNNK